VKSIKPDAMNNRIEKLDRIKNIDAFLLTSSVSLKYLTGYFYNFEIGPSPFQLIPAALFVVPSHYSGLIIADNESDQLALLDSRIKVNPYASYSYEKPLDYSASFCIKLLELIAQTGMGKARIGVEADSLPYSICESLSMNYPDIELVDITTDLVNMRMVKDEDELMLIHAATHLCDVGQEAVIKYAKPGMTELDLFKMVRGDMEMEAGKRIPMMTDLVAGLRTFEGGGNPSSNRIASGDLILSDLTPCLNGYWGDTCSTIVLGKPTPQQQYHFNLVKEALAIGVNAIKPGVQAKVIDHLMRKHLSSAGQYGHHSGHGVGIAYHEEPRIVPYNDKVLEPNMVIALEPAIYHDNYGIRLEHIVAVTPTGCEVLSQFKHRFEI
jgi:Xaa-Pro dipeptidase